MLVVIGGPIINPINKHVTIANPSGTMAKIGSVVFALACAPATFHAYIGLKNSNPVKWLSVSSYAVVIGALMCCVMGIGTVSSSHASYID